MTGPISYTAMNENGVMSPAEKNGKIPTCHTGLPDTEEEEPDNGEKCGWGSIQPQICQRFRHPKWVLFWLSMAGAVQVSKFLILFFATCTDLSVSIKTNLCISYSCFYLVDYGVNEFYKKRNWAIFFILWLPPEIWLAHNSSFFLWVMYSSCNHCNWHQSVFRILSFLV